MLATLHSIFESKATFDRGRFDQRQLDLLNEFLMVNVTFKHKRMHILFDELKKSSSNTIDPSQWAEWFHWYFSISKAENMPLWLLQFQNSLAAHQSNIHIYSYADLLSLGWQVEDIVMSSIALSASGIQDYFPNDNEVQHWTDLRRKNLDLFTGVVIGGELVAQVGFIKLSDDEYMQMSHGKLSEDALTGDIKTHRETIYLYIPSVVIKKAYRKRGFLTHMLNHLFEQLITNKQVYSHVNGLIAVTYSDDGRRLCRSAGMTPNPKSGSQDIYTGTMQSFKSSDFVKHLSSKTDISL